MTDKEQENLIDLIVDVARNSCNDGFNEHNANREAEIVVQNLVKKLNITDVSKCFECEPMEYDIKGIRYFKCKHCGTKM